MSQGRRSNNSDQSSDKDSNQSSLTSSQSLDSTSSTSSLNQSKPSSDNKMASQVDQKKLDEDITQKQSQNIAMYRRNMQNYYNSSWLGSRYPLFKPLTEEQKQEDEMKKVQNYRDELERFIYFLNYQTMVRSEEKEEHIDITIKLFIANVGIFSSLLYSGYHLIALSVINTAQRRKQVVNGVALFIVSRLLLQYWKNEALEFQKKMIDYYVRSLPERQFKSQLAIAEQTLLSRYKEKPRFEKLQYFYLHYLRIKQRPNQLGAQPYDLSTLWMKYDATQKQKQLGIQSKGNSTDNRGLQKR